MKTLIIGSGGHARVVADILLADRDAEPLGFISPSSTPGETILGLSVLGNDNALDAFPHDGVVLAIGDNRARARIYDQYSHANRDFISAIHPSAIIAPDVEIEPGCMVCAGVVINSGSRIGANTILNTGCTVDHDCVIGPHVHIGPGANLAGNVTVREGTFIGIGSCVIQGIQIGEWVTVGAGAAVVQDILPNTTVVGVPARELSAKNRK